MQNRFVRLRSKKLRDAGGFRKEQNGCDGKNQNMASDEIAKMPSWNGLLRGKERLLLDGLRVHTLLLDDGGKVTISFYLLLVSWLKHSPAITQLPGLVTRQHLAKKKG